MKITFKLLSLAFILGISISSTYAIGVESQNDLNASNSTKAISFRIRITDQYGNFVTEGPYTEQAMFDTLTPGVYSLTLLDEKGNEMPNIIMDDYVKL